MSLVSRAMGREKVAEEGPQPYTAPKKILHEVDSTASESFDFHMKQAGLDLTLTQESDSENEKVASFSDKTDTFRLNAEKAVLAEVASNLYHDPILERLMSIGNVKTAMELAEGRYASKHVLDKLAEYTEEDIRTFAEVGLERRVKLAESIEEDEVYEGFSPRLEQEVHDECTENRPKLEKLEAPVGRQENG